ncbi:hypothetical protein ACFQ1S_07185, partial [Kibdelosporangium lantanae]
MTGASATASTTDAAFDTTAGVLNVDRASYLSKHDIVYNRANTNPLYGLTVGNGRMGAMAWQQNGLTMQVSGVDTSQQTAFGAGLVNLSTTPQQDIAQQRLSLYDGTLTTRYDNRTVTVMGSPNSEVMGIHVDDNRTGVQAVQLDLSLWDVSNLGNSGDVPNLDTWKQVSTFADSAAAGLSRGQADPQNFGYTLAATVEGTSFTTQASGNKVSLRITPSTSYTIWFTASTRLNAPNHDSVTQARNALNQVRNTGYTTTLNNFRNWWHAFWDRSFVQYSNSNSSRDADYMENVYYLSTYMIAAGGYANYPYHFINGVFRATQDSTKWSNAYWYWNQRDVYNSFLSSNHVDLLSTLNNMYSRNFGNLKSLTQSRYGIDGIWVPETMGWDGNARGTVNSDYTKNIYSTGTEAAYNMYLQYRYSNDVNYLRNTAYPFMREVVKFYAAKLSFNGSKYYMATSNAHETYWNVPNAITDLASVRLLFPLTVQTSEQLGLDANLRAQWTNIVNNLIAYPTDGSAYLPHQPPIAQTRNGENVASELIWPYDQTGIGFPDQQMATTTWNRRPFPYGNVWANDAVQAARLGLGDQAYQGMRTMLQKYQNYPNGMTNNTNGVFEYLGVHLAAMNESLMQSYNGKIRVFPAVPSDLVGKFTLLAKDGFLVSSEREAGETKYVGIRSLYGKSTRVVNPWGTQQVRVRRASDNAILTTTSSAEFDLATTANTVYVVERTAKPLTSYAATRLTG